MTEALDISEGSLARPGIVLQLELPPNRIVLLSAATGTDDRDAA